MTKEEHIKYWIESAEHDLTTTDVLLASAKYDWALFIGHLVLEKALKAIYVQNFENKIPPKLHNLVRLAEISSLELNEERRLLFDRINDFNIEARYPEYKNEFYKYCTKVFAEEYLDRIKDSYKWIKSHLK